MNIRVLCRWMKLELAALMLAVLSGCASTITSQVTAFHDWPAAGPERSFFIDDSKHQNDLEFKNYAELVRAQLLQLGFRDGAPAPVLKVTLDYSSNGRDVREVYPVQTNPWYDSPWGPFGPFPGRYYRHPFYNPWYGVPMIEYREQRYALFNHQLRVEISRVRDGKKLYDVTVTSENRNVPLAAAMPYLVKSAFADFPGPSGVPRTVELKMTKQGPEPGPPAPAPGAAQPQR